MSVKQIAPGKSDIISLLRFYIIFQSFSSVPEVQVTVKHNIPNQKQDAMNVWIENVTTSQFEVCLRESRTFDGPHSNLAVVCRSNSVCVVVVVVVCKILPPILLVSQYLLVVLVHRNLLLNKKAYVKQLTPSTKNSNPAENFAFSRNYYFFFLLLIAFDTFFYSSLMMVWPIPKKK